MNGFTREEVARVCLAEGMYFPEHVIDQLVAAIDAGKHVILAFDNDEPGAAATLRVSKLLRSNARSLGKLNWEGLQYAARAS